MRPAIGKLDTRTDPVRCNQSVVSGISIRLQDTSKALQYPLGMLPAPTGGIGEDHARWCRAAPWPVITGQGPEVSGLGLSRPRVKDRGARLIHEELGGSLQVGHQRLMYRAEFEGGASHPIGKGGAVEIDALAAVDLGLAVKRQVIGILADQHMGDRGLGGHATGD